MDRNIEKIKQLLKESGVVSFAYLYGSYLMETETAQDIDVAIYVRDYAGVLETECTMAEDMMERAYFIAGRPVHIRVLNEAPVEFQLEVVETGIPIYISDEESFTNYLESLSRKAIETIQYRYSIEGELCRL